MPVIHANASPDFDESKQILSCFPIWAVKCLVSFWHFNPRLSVCTVLWQTFCFKTHILYKLLVICFFPNFSGAELQHPSKNILNLQFNLPNKSAALLSLSHVVRPSKQCSCERVSEARMNTWLRVLLVTTPPNQGKDISVLCDITMTWFPELCAGAGKRIKAWAFFSFSFLGSFMDRL